MTRHVERTTIAQLDSTAYRLAVAGIHVDQAVAELHSISADIAPLTEAAVPYMKDNPHAYEQRAAELLQAAGADLDIARELWATRTVRAKRRHPRPGNQLR